MPTLHVFVDANGTLLAAAPAPAPPVEGSTAPIFAGISPAEPVEGMEAFEVTVDDGEGWGSEALQRRVGELLRNKDALRRVEIRR